MKNSGIISLTNTRFAFLRSIIQRISARKNLFFYCCLILISLFASFLIWYITKSSFSKWGFSDSAVYFSSARNFASGIGVGIFNPNGAFTRLTIFAPFYPIVLGLFVKVGIDPFAASRIIDILTFGSFIFFLGHFFFTISSSRVLSLVIAILCVCNHQMIVNFTSLQSEPLAFALGFSGFLTTILFIVRKRKRLLYISGLLVGLGLLTRYAFIAFPIAGVLIMIMFLKSRLKEKLFTILQYSLLSFGPIFAWLCIELFHGRTIGGRQFLFDGSLFTQFFLIIRNMIQILNLWVPFKPFVIQGLKTELMIPILLLFFGLIVVLGFLSYFWRKKKEHELNRLPLILAISFVLLFLVYTLVIIFSNLFTDLSAIRDRILSPLIPTFFGVLISSLLMFNRYTTRTTPVIWMTSLILLFFFVKFNYPPILSIVYSRNEPSPAWVNKPIFEVIRKMEISKSDIVFSNGPDMVLFYTNIYPYYLTNSQVSLTGVELSEGLDSTLDKCQIYFLFPPDFINKVQRLHDPVTTDSIVSLTSVFHVHYSDTDGTILFNNYCEKNFE